MSTFFWILLFGILMSLIALVGAVTLVLPERIFDRVIPILVSLAAGTLIGTAMFHLLPQAIIVLGNSRSVYISFSIGFILFFMFEQFLHWHHCHRSMLHHKPVSYLILSADTLHNFIGGIAVGAAFIADIKLGMITWAVAAAHEIPQELGDFGILIKSGWEKRAALFFNFLSAITFPIGGICVYFLSIQFNPIILLPFAAGNFFYIGAADLLPELKSTNLATQFMQFLSFIVGFIVIASLA